MKYFWLAILAWLTVLGQSVLVFYLPFWLLPNLILILLFNLALRQEPAELLFFALSLGIFEVYFNPEMFWAPAVYGLFALVLAGLNRYFSLTQNLAGSVLIFTFLSGAVFFLHFFLFHFSFSARLFLPWLITVILASISVAVTKFCYEKSL